jgi:hypothetical protein
MGDAILYGCILGLAGCVIWLSYHLGRLEKRLDLLLAALAKETK